MVHRFDGFSTFQPPSLPFMAFSEACFNTPPRSIFGCHSPRGILTTLGSYVSIYSVNKRILASQQYPDRISISFACKNVKAAMDVLFISLTQMASMRFRHVLKERRKQARAPICAMRLCAVKSCLSWQSQSRSHGWRVRMFDKSAIWALHTDVASARSTPPGLPA